MKRFASAIAAFVIAGAASLAPVRSAPPTVTPSPGYDARLQEQRAATSPVIEPAAPAAKPVLRRHVKHRHDGAR